jgi:translation initiation factor RLI1
LKVEAGSFTDSEIIVMLGENGMSIAIMYSYLEL